MKKWLAILICVTLLIGIFTPMQWALNDVLEQNFRNGFKLEPQSFDSTGVATDSGYMLTTKEPFNLNEVQKGISIDGEPVPKVAMEGNNRFLITLKRPLLENKLYTFRLNLGEETKWTFQTQAPFSVVSSLPGNESNRVPLTSGIEIYFSHRNFGDLSEYFEITPSVEGAFEVHDKVGVFVPKELLPETMYTVKIKKGLKILQTQRALTNDYTFSFETISREEDKNEDTSKGSISFTQSLYDVSSEIAPSLPLYYWINRDVYTKEKLLVKTNVYAYGNFNDFATQYKNSADVPRWLYDYQKKTKFPTDHLTKVAEFSQEFYTQMYSRGDGENYLNLPEQLPKGYYLLDCTWEDINFQALLQVTDTNIFLTKSNTKTLVWVTDKMTKMPLEGARLSFLSNQKTYTTNRNGIAFFDTNFNENNGSFIEYLQVTLEDGFTSLLDASGYEENEEDSYWNHMQMDRNLYQPDDTVKVWGFVKNRYRDEDMRNFTLELTGENFIYRRFFPLQQTVLMTKRVEVNNGFFTGEFQLPKLDEGYYEITLKKGDKHITSTYFTVEKYTPPAYTMHVSKDKEAIFPGETVNFDIKTSFFEGTAVPNLPTTVMFYGGLIGGNDRVFNERTDVSGKLTIPYKAKVSDTISGQHTVGMYARATLPEQGQIEASNSVRVFVNDIDVDLDGTIMDGKGTIEARINSITLDRLNEGSAVNSWDYIGKPVKGTTLTGTIFKNTWVKKEMGQTYDFINKVSRKNYRYEPKKTAIREVLLTSDEKGFATTNFQIPADDTDGYYTAELKTLDQSGRRMNLPVSLRSYSPYFKRYITPERYIDHTIHLNSGQEEYSIGDTVDLLFKKGTDVLPTGKFLYITAQNGIRSFEASLAPNFQKVFTKEDMPNLSILGVYLDEYGTYNTAYYNVSYKMEDRRLNIEGSFDKKSYKPGDKVTLDMHVTDMNGNPVQASINVGVVDEAFLSLSDYDVDALNDLFSQVNNGIFSTHTSYASNQYGIYSEAMSSTRTDTVSAKMSTSKEDTSVNIREDFKDTAIFQAIETDEWGRGKITFTLPDNMTSWRVSLDGISKELYGGESTFNISASLPFFINHSLNASYLVGDEPVIGVNAYGEGLFEDELVRFEIQSIKNPKHKVSAVGRAFERVNIPLWKMEEGLDELVIKAYTNQKLQDAVKHPIHVVKSYYTLSKHELLDVAVGMKLTGGSEGNTKILFTDKGRGQFLYPLLELRNPTGKRVDQKLAAREAQRLLNQYFVDKDFLNETMNFDIKEYQQSDGGFSLLPYGESQSELSALLTSYLMDEANNERLKGYFYQLYEKEDAYTKAVALLGLATLHEPVLLDLEAYAKIDNLTIKDLLFIALAFVELGELERANALYDDLSKSFQTNAPYTYVKSERSKDASIELTMLTAILASKLNRQEKEGMFAYIRSNGMQDVYLGLLEVIYIQRVIEEYTPEAASLTYMFNDEEKNVNLEGRWGHILEVPSALVGSVKITKLSGDIAAISTYREGVDVLEYLKDANIGVERTYTHLDGSPLEQNTLKQGDVIQVKIRWWADEKALDGEYEITDYLPSGLKPMKTNGYFANDHKKNDGQKVSFTVYKGIGSTYGTDIQYMARVISPGVYIAQGTTIQNAKAEDGINWAKNETVRIDANNQGITTPLDPNRIKVAVNEFDVIFDVEPLILDGRTLVPMRAIFEVLGAQVNWNPEKRTVTGTRGDKRVELVIDSNMAKVNGEEKRFDVPAKILQNRTYVPVRFISESLGADVKWESDTKTVRVAE